MGNRNVPSMHQGPEYEEKYGDKDWYPSDDEEPESIEERVDSVDVSEESDSSGKYKHIVGSVYWDSRPRYLIAELPLIALAVLPPERVIDATGPFWEWLLSVDFDFAVTLSNSYPQWAFILFLVVFLSRLSIDPDDAPPRD